MNERALRAKMLMMGVSVERVCEAAGICKASYYRKERGETQFTQKEMQAIVDLLDMTAEEIRDIFFNKKVS